VEGDVGAVKGGVEALKAGIGDVKAEVGALGTDVRIKNENVKTVAWKDAGVEVGLGLILHNKLSSEGLNITTVSNAVKYIAAQGRR
jgi:hypothetical protein